MGSLDDLVVVRIPRSQVKGGHGQHGVGEIGGAGKGQARDFLDPDVVAKVACCQGLAGMCSVMMHQPQFNVSVAACRDARGWGRTGGGLNSGASSDRLGDR